MAEPTTARGRETKALIVQAAAGLMYERGVRGTTVDDVLAEARCGKSQLYHYFSDKDELVAAVLESQLAQVLADQGRFDLSTWAGWRAWFDALVEGQEARGFHGCPVGSLAIEMSAMGPDARSHVADAFSQWQSSLEHALIEMKDNGDLRASARPRELAQTTMAIIQGGYLLSTASHEPGPMREAVSAAYAHLRSFRTADERT